MNPEMTHMETTLDPTHPLDPTTVKTRAARRSWAGIALSGLAVAFLALDGGIKLVPIQPVVEAFQHLGVPLELASSIGLLQLACLALYVIPRTAPLGALLLTGFLGGAILTHLRVGDPLLSHTLFPIYVALLLWGGLALRDPRPLALLRGTPAR
jgi:hypothetical protein